MSAALRPEPAAPTVAWSTRAERDRRALDDVGRKQVARAMEMLHHARPGSDMKHAKMYALWWEPDAYALKASRRLRVILDRMPGGWSVREIVDRADRRYYRGEK